MRGGVVEVWTAEEHGLDDDVTVEGLQMLDDGIDIVGTSGTVDTADELWVDGVELLDVVVYQHQRVMDGRTVNLGAIRQYRHLGRGTETVAQLDGIADDGGEVGVARGLAVAGKGQHVGPLPLLSHLAQLVPQGESYILARR